MREYAQYIGFVLLMLFAVTFAHDVIPHDHNVFDELEHCHVEQTYHDHHHHHQFDFFHFLSHLFENGADGEDQIILDQDFEFAFSKLQVVVLYVSLGFPIEFLELEDDTTYYNEYEDVKSEYYYSSECMRGPPSLV